MAEHMAKNYDTAEASAFLLPAGKHRVSPLHPLDLLCKALASTCGCVVTEWSRIKPGQTAGFQSFRIRTFNLRGNCRRHKKVNSIMTLNPLSFAGKRLRPKAFSPVCPSRLEFLPLIPITRWH